MAQENQPLKQQPGQYANQQTQLTNFQSAMPGVPGGLEYLTQLDTLVIKQKKEMLEIVTGFEQKNRYEIRDAQGQLCYFAAEESGCCSRVCCGQNRGFNIHISDTTKSSEKVTKIVLQKTMIRFEFF